MEELIEQMLDGKILLAEAVAEFEEIYIQKALKRNGNHLMRTADALGIHRNTLSRRLNGHTKPSQRVLAKRRKKAKR
jgi:DNA-binding NtrC family response regulator